MWYNPGKKDHSHIMTHELKSRVDKLVLTLAVALLCNSILPAQTKSEPSEPPPHAEKPKTPPLTITLDTSQAPEMAQWAAEAKSRCEKFYPTIVKQLGGPYAHRPLSVTIAFRDEPGVAGTSGTHIGCSSRWFSEHPDDYGALIHELCHVVQAYGHPNVPGWVTEGIADYVRWFNYEPPARHPRPDPETAKYTDGYQTTAAFFDWIVRTKNKSFVQRLNSAARNGKYSDDLFRQYAHKPLDDLWEEFIESLRQR
jgi:hypothetical protein